VNQIDKISFDLSRMSQRAVAALGDGSEKVSMTFIEATLVGVLANLNFQPEVSRQVLHENFVNMMRRKNFAEAARYAVASEANVKSRLLVAIEEFRAV
jgi:hypothetical protein